MRGGRQRTPCEKHLRPGQQLATLDQLHRHLMPRGSACGQPDLSKGALAENRRLEAVVGET